MTSIAKHIELSGRRHSRWAALLCSIKLPSQPRESIRRGASSWSPDWVRVHTRCLMRGAMLTLNMKTPCCGAEKRPVSLLYAWPKLVTTVSNVTSVPSSVRSSGTLRVAMKATRGTLSLRPSRRDTKPPVKRKPIMSQNTTEHNKSRAQGTYRRCPEFLRAEGRVISQEWGRCECAGSGAAGSRR